MKLTQAKVTWAVLGLVLAVRLPARACDPPDITKYCWSCEKNACESFPANHTASCPGGECTPGLPQLRLGGGVVDVAVEDVPIRGQEVKGLPFTFSMWYVNTDARVRAVGSGGGSSGGSASLASDGHRWSVGDHWSHEYERYVTVVKGSYSTGSSGGGSSGGGSLGTNFDENVTTYSVIDPGGSGAVFEWDGTNFTEQLVVGHVGQWSLAWEGDNLHARKRSWYGPRSKAERGECGGCGGGGCGGSPQPEQVSVPGMVWSAQEGCVFEPDPVVGGHYRLKSVIGRDGYETTLGYDGESRITNVVSASGREYRFTYNASGFLTNVADVVGSRSASFAYTNDLLVSVTDAAGQTFFYGYDSDGKLTSFKKPDGNGGYNETTLTYTGNYKAATHVAIRHPDGTEGYMDWETGLDENVFGMGVTHYSFSDYTWNKSPVEKRDPIGRLTSYVYYDNTNSILMGRVKKICHPDGTVTENRYDDKGNMTERLFYDSALNLVNKKVSTYVYFPATDCPNTITQEVQDAQGQCLSRQTQTYARDERGTTNDVSDDVYTLVSETDWATTNTWSETCYQYDTNFLLIDVRQRTGPATNDFRTVQSFTWNTNRQPVAVSDALTNTIYVGYDDLCRVAWKTRYLARGNPGTNDDIAVTSTYEYDSLDRLTRHVHLDGVEESWTYNGCGCGTAVHVDRGGNSEESGYDVFGREQTRKTTTANGTVVAYVRYERDAAGNILKEYDALSNMVEHVYNAAGDPMATVDARGGVTTFYYDDAGRQHMTEFPDASTVKNTYDAGSRIIKTARYANIWALLPLTTEEYTYDAMGRRVTAMDALGNVTSNSYDLQGRVVRVTQPDGACSETEYDLLGNVIATIGPVQPGATDQEKAAATMSIRYDEIDRRVAVVDGLSRTNAWEYDADWPQQVARSRNANGQISEESFYDALTGLLLTNVVDQITTVYEYNTLGQVVRMGFPDNTVASNRYDGPRLIGATDRAGNSTAYAFDLVGRVTAFTNGRGYVVRFGYDAAGNRTNMVDALTNRTGYVYDSMNRVIRTILPDGRVSTNTYDSLGRLTARTGAGSVPGFFEYDAAGRMAALVDGMTNRTTFAYDAMGRLMRKTYADGTFFAYGYNARGWLTNRVDAFGRSTAYSYDAVGQLTTVDYSTGPDVVNNYDLLGRMTSRVDAAGTWCWTYDGESRRRLSEDLTSSSVTSTVSYAYHTNTHELASVGTGGFTTEYSWVAGRLATVAASDGSAEVGNWDYSYVPGSDLVAGLRAEVSSGSPLAVSRTYDEADRLTSISATNNAGVINAFEYGLDAVGRRTARTDADGTQTAWGYDAFDQLVSAGRTNGPNGAVDAAYRRAYQYDGSGNRLHEDRGQMGLAGAFNELNQLTINTWTGKLDIVGAVAATNAVVLVQGLTNAPPFCNGTNWLGGAVVQAASNAIPIVVWAGTNSTETNLAVYLPPANPQVFQYDANGNLTNDGQRAYAWDEENRLVAVEMKAGLVQPRLRSEYTYDAQGRRVRAVDLVCVTNNDFEVTGTRQFVYDGWNLISEICHLPSEMKTYTNTFVWGFDLGGTLQGAGGVGGLLAVSRSSTNSLQPSVCFPIYDGNGNVTDLVNTNGVVVGHYDYDPFGNTVRQSGAVAQSNHFRFSTKYFEANWNLYNFGYRYYSPGMRRWLSLDPLGDHASPGARELNGNLVKQMTYAAIVMLNRAFNDRMDVESRVGALNEAIYWIDGIRVLNSGDPSFSLRWDDPYVSLWTLQNPLGISGGVNLYAYCGNDPGNFVDLLGLAVYNNSDVTIWVKPEKDMPGIKIKGNDAYPIKPGGCWPSGQDGIAVPTVRPGEVYKNVTGTDVTVNKDGTVNWSTDAGGVIDWAEQTGGQIARGGWKKKDWQDKLHKRKPPDDGWDKLFKKSTPCDGKK